MQLIKFLNLSYKPKYIFFGATLYSLAIVLIFNNPTLYGDEPRYLSFADNILNGFYAKKDLNPGFLWTGPGYPLILSFLKAFKANLLLYRILNIFFIITGIYYVYKFLLLFFKQNTAIIISIIGGFSNPYIFHALSKILSESLSFFLFNAAIYYLYIFYNSRHKKYLFIGSFYSGFLILTKVIFAYVFLALFLVTFFFYLIRKLDLKYILTSITPFIFCIPYLFYTYSITNKIFFWSDAGGSTLYSISTPYEDEYGDWFPASINEKNPEVKFSRSGSITTKPKMNPPYFQKHLSFLVSISSLNGIERDAMLKKKAIENIINHPIKYIKNILSNISRIFFRTPFTDRELKTTFKVFFYPYGFVLLTCYIFSLFSSFFLENRTAVKIITLFVLIFLLGTSLLSAESRFIFPIYGIFIALISIQIKNFISWRSQKVYR